MKKLKETVLQYDKDDYGKLKCIRRNPENATDTASTESVLLEFAEKVEVKTIVLIQATSPLLTSKDLDGALEKFAVESYDSLLSLVRQKRFIWEVTNRGLVTPSNYKVDSRPRRQEFNGFFVENGAFYITRYDALIQSKTRISGRIGYYEMPEETYVEIDEPEDWIIIEHLLQKRKTEPLSRRMKNIQLLATDCDGVLTDAGMYYSNDGDVLKKFNTKDGMGLSLLKQKGFILAIITGENSQIVKREPKN